MAKGFPIVFPLLLCTLQVTAVVQGLYYDVCPRDDISPCTCDHEGMNCNLVTELRDVENAFKARFKYNAIRALFLQGTQLKVLSPEIFQCVKIQEIYLEDNQLISFDLAVLNHSTDFTRTINLFHNQITKFKFGDLKSFPKLQSLNLGRNRLARIPDDAFSENAELTEIALHGNSITTVEANTFSNLPNLKLVLLASNAIQTLGPNSMNFHSGVKGLQVDLQNNSISEISKLAFGKGDLSILALGRNKLKYLDKDVFADLSRNVGNKGGRIDVQRNPLTCTGCEYKWMIPERYVLQEIITNFFCPDGSSLAQLTIHKIKCSKK